MGLTEWLGVGQFVLTAVVALLVWVWGRYRDLALIIRRLDEIERRLDAAGKRSSDLADTVQVMPDKWRADIRYEHDRIWAAIDQMRMFGRGAV